MRRDRRALHQQAHEKLDRSDKKRDSVGIVPGAVCAMLADIYNWFTEGFDTADLKDAKALLEELDG